MKPCEGRLKKSGMTNRKIEYWVIPPEADAEFVAGMEEVLDTYATPYDPANSWTSRASSTEMVELSMNNVPAPTAGKMSA